MDEIFKNLSNKRDFIYKDQIDELFYVNILKTKFQNMIEDISEIEDHIDDFIFCHDVIDGSDNIKYLYISKIPNIQE